jgi:hypothetical protein
LADNLTTTTTVSTVPASTVIATDDIGGAHVQRVKLSCGPDGTATDVPVGGGVEAAALRVTLANDSTGLVSVDDNGGSLTVDNGGTFAVQATVAAGATTIAKAEDVASADADVGVPAMAVRKASPANTSGTDGDYEMLQMSAGRLWVSATVDAALPAGSNAIGKLAANSGVDIGDVDVTSVVPGTTATSLGKAEDGAHSTGDTGVMALAVRRGTPGNLSGTDGDYEPLQVSAGRLWASATIDTALPAGTNAIGKLAANSGVDIGDVDVTSIVPGTGATNLGKAEDAGHSSGDVGVMALSVRQDAAAALGGTDADYQPLITDASGRLHVTASGGIGGTVAHDGADSGNPVKVGGKARTTNPTAVADADRVDATFDDIGRQVVVLSSVRDLVGQQTTTITNSTSETTFVTAAGSGVFADLTHLTITNASATAFTVTIKDATGGTTRAIYDIAANGGAVLSFPVPFTQASSNNNWTATLSVNTVTVHLNAQYIKNV